MTVRADDKKRRDRHRFIVWSPLEGFCRALFTRRSARPADSIGRCIRDLLGCPIAHIRRVIRHAAHDLRIFEIRFTCETLKLNCAATSDDGTPST